MLLVSLLQYAMSKFLEKVIKVANARAASTAKPEGNSLTKESLDNGRIDEKDS